MKGGEVNKGRTGDIFSVTMNVERKERNHCLVRVEEGSVCNLSAFHFIL